MSVQLSKSQLINFFTKIDSYNYKCKTCGKTYKTPNGGISNLRTHYAIYIKDTVDKVILGKRKTQTVLLPFNAEPYSIDVDNPDEPQIRDTGSSCYKHSKAQQTLPNMVMDIKSTESGSKALKITNAIAYYIFKDNVPFKTVENEGFKNLMQTACPLYKIPSRNTFTKRIDEIYDVMSIKFKESLLKIDNIHIAVTTDVWTETMQMKSFLGITLHLIEDFRLVSRTIGTVELDESHTAQYIGRCLVETLANWRLEKHNVVAVVTDSGANIKKAIINEYTADKHVSCVAHTINLVVEKAIEKTQELNTETNIKSGGVPLLISKVRDIVKFVKRSSKANDLLRKYQIIEGKKEGQFLKLILDIKTRWNSCFYMIERFLKLAKYISQILLTLNGIGIPEMISGLELRGLSDICNLLKAFEVLTRELSTEKSVMSSKVIPLISGTKNEVVKQNPNVVVALRLKVKLLEELDYRCGFYEQAPLLPICTLLDPRFKDMHFQNPIANSKAQEKIVQMIDNDTNIEINNELPTIEAIEKDNNDKHCDLWGLHKSLEQKRNDERSSSNTARDELNLYLKQNVLKLNEDPLIEWKKTEFVYPKLFKLAMKYLIIPATSVPSERLFSKAGETISKTRNRLTGSRLSKLLFLQSVDKSLWDL